jgi:hypothetical protein
MIEKKIELRDKEDKVFHTKVMMIPETMNEEGYLVPGHKAGARFFTDISFPKGMTDEDLGRMTRLSKLMTGNLLGYRSHSEVKAYAEQNLINIVGLSHRRGKEFISRMLNLKVMKIVNGEYWVNPAYFMSTGQSRISMSLWNIFREELKPIMPDWVYWDYVRRWQTIHPYAEIARK